MVLVVAQVADAEVGRGTDAVGAASGTVWLAPSSRRIRFIDYISFLAGAFILSSTFSVDTRPRAQSLYIAHLATWILALSLLLTIRRVLGLVENWIVNLLLRVL